MCRHCRILWTWNLKVEKRAVKVQEGFLSSEQFHYPDHRPQPLMNSMATPCSKTRHFGSLFSFFLFFDETRDILGKFWIHSCWSSTVARDNLQLEKVTVSFVPSSLMDWRQPMGRANCGKSTRVKRWTAVPWKMYNRTLVFQFSQLY